MKKKLLLAALALFLLTSCAANNTSPDKEDITPPSVGTDTESSPSGEDTAQTGTDEDGKILAAYDTYTQLMKSMSAQPGEDAQYDMDFTTDMSITMGEMSVPVSVGGNIKMITTKDGGIQYSAVMDMSEAGAGVIEMLFDGQNIYCSINGEEIEIDADTMLDQIGGVVDMPEFDLSAVQSAETKPAEGGTETTIVINGQALTDYALGAAADAMGDLGIEMGMDISDVTIVVVADGSGIPKSMRLEMDMLMSAVGADIKMGMVCTFVFNKFGEGIEIDFSRLASL